jgi:5-methyltetrahydropteroyltriglutamate--homocysteine methyltransferase
MAIKTTCIGAFPKPDYISATNWSESGEQVDGESAARQFSYANSTLMPDTSDLFDRATQDAIGDQVACGIDIPTDGEQRRENYIHYHCRHFEGIDFENLTRKVHRDGAAVADLPTISGRLQDALQHIDAHRLIAAPDCGLTMLERDLAMKKLANLSAAARATS